MSLFDKKMSKEKRASFELAEDSRQSEWRSLSFVAGLFQGKVDWKLIFPFPRQSQEEKQKGDEILAKIKEIVKSKINPDKVDETREIPQEAIDQLFEIGAFAMKIPAEYNGLGLGHLNYNRAVHLLGSYCGSTAALLSAHQSIGVPQPLILCGTKEQKKKYLPRFRQGAISGFALTEEEAGSDPRMMKTTATPSADGKYYLLNGEKLWCTNGNIADVLVVMALTPPKMVRGKEKKQITAFIVEANSPGFEVVYRCKFMGLNAIQNGVIRFTNVKVPKENIILGEGEGLKLAFLTLNTGRLTLPAAVTGTSKWCLSVARKWATQRRQWGSAIGDHEAVSTKLSDMTSTTFAMDAMMQLVSSMAEDKRLDIRIEAAIAKLFCTEESWKVIYEAIQIRGGRGYETAPSLAGRGKPAFALERVMRDARINTILEGSSEIMRLFIAREALDFHLRPMKCLFDPRASVTQKIKVALTTALTYLFWYPRLWMPCFCPGGVKVTRPLKKHMRFIRAMAKRLARDIFHNMVVYQKKLVSKQNILSRFVDIGMDLFAMSCAVSYADSLGKEGTDKNNALELADLFCRQAEVRIRNKFKSIYRNHDKLSKAIAKSVLAGEFEWLENDIIKE